VRKAFILLISVLVITAVLLTGCNAVLTPSSKTSSDLPAPSASPGKLEVRLTDAPPDPQITSVKITIESVAVHMQGRPDSEEDIDTTAPANTTVIPKNETGNGKNKGQSNKGQNQQQAQQSTLASSEPNDDSGWKTLDIASGSLTVDLLTLQGISQSLAAGSFVSGNYSQIRLEVSQVMVSYKDGNTIQTEEAKLPSSTLKIIHPFEIGPDQITTLLLDFDALKSIHVTGNGEIMCKPVIKVSGGKPSNQDEHSEDKNPAEKMQITPATLPNGKVGQPYNADLNVTGGTAPYTWSIPNGLPAGLNVNSATGIITGTPLVANTYHFTVKLSDSSNVPDVNEDYTIVVDP
jgi:hypothetical protein